MIKTFDVPLSDDPTCLTSYSNGLDQFDAKSNYPNATTLVRFFRNIDEINAEWADAWAPSSPP